jgi:hypothetical protein
MTPAESRQVCLPPDLPPDLHTHLLERVRQAYRDCVVGHAERSSQRFQALPPQLDLTSFHDDPHTFGIYESMGACLLVTDMKVVCTTRQAQTQAQAPHKFSLYMTRHDGTTRVILSRPYWKHDCGPPEPGLVRFMAGLLRDLAEGRGPWHSFAVSQHHRLIRLAEGLARHAAAWREWVSGELAVEVDAAVASGATSRRLQRAVSVALLPLQQQSRLVKTPF